MLNKPRGFMALEILVLLGFLSLAGAATHFAWGVYEDVRLACAVWQYRAIGEPMAPSDLRDPPLMPAENAVVDMRAAVKLADDEGKDSKWFFDRAFDKPVRDTEIERLGRYVEPRLPAIERLKQARGKEVDWGVDWRSPMVMTLLPDLNEQRGLANFLSGASALAHAKENDGEAIERAGLMLLQARAVRRQPVIISQLVGAGIDSLAAQTIENMLPRLKIGEAPGAVKEAQLRPFIDELLDDRELTDGWRNALRGERVSQVDCAHMLVAGRLGLTSTNWTKESTDPADAIAGYLLKPLILRDVREMLDIDQQDIRHADATDWPTMREQLSKRVAGITDTPGFWVTRVYFFRRMVMPSLERAALTGFRVRVTRNLISTALALRWYSVEHDGKFPASLDELTPKYLKQVPRDAFAAGASKLRYNNANGSALVYSVGEDGADDGGSESLAPGAKRGAGRWSTKDAVLKIAPAK